MEGYSRAPDYDDFWLERDYLKDAGNFRAAVLLAHGWQDYNVKQDEGVRLFEALGDSVPFKRAYLFQGRTQTPSGETWDALLDAFFEHTLQGVDNGVETGPAVITEGRTVGDVGLREHRASAKSHRGRPRDRGTRRSGCAARSTRTCPASRCRRPGRASRACWPSEPNTEPKDNVFTWVDTGAATEEFSTRDPFNEPGHGYYSLYFKSEPIEADTRLAGRAVLDAIVRHHAAGAHLTPILVDVAPDGSHADRRARLPQPRLPRRPRERRSGPGRVGARRGSSSCRRTSRSSRAPHRPDRAELEHRLGAAGRCGHREHPHRPAARRQPGRLAAGAAARQRPLDRL